MASTYPWNDEVPMTLETKDAKFLIGKLCTLREGMFLVAPDDSWSASWERSKNGPILAVGVEMDSDNPLPENAITVVQVLNVDIFGRRGPFMVVLRPDGSPARIPLDTAVANLVPL